MSVPTQPLDTDALRAAGVQFARPGDPGFDAARTGFLLNAPADAGLVAFPADAAGVAEVLRAARAAGLPVAPQRTGHGCAPRRALEGGVLLRTDRLTGVEIDPVRRIARVGAATLWGEVCEAAQAHGLWPLAGSSPTVGVVGYCLGGGLSFLARTHGLACHGVRAVEFVSSDGELVRADEHGHAAAVHEACDALTRVLEPVRVGAYRNFDEHAGAPTRFHDQATLTRLQAILAEWDPSGMLIAHHEIQGG